MYIRKTGYVMSTQNHNFNTQEKLSNHQLCRVVKTGRVLTLREEGIVRYEKSADIASIANQGLDYYQVISNQGACERCQEHNGAIYPVGEAKDGENLPPFHPNCKCAIQGFSTKNPNYDPWTQETLFWLDIMYGDGSMEQKAQKVIDFYSWTDFSVDFIAKALSAIDDINHIGKRIAAFFARLNRTPQSETEFPTNVSDQGLKLLQALEGFIAKPYSGVDFWNQTVGYGHVIQPGENFDNEITEEEATELLKQDLQKFHTTLRNFITENNLNLSQNQYDALLIFSYQLGPNVWNRDDYDFIQLLKSGAWTDAQIVYEMGRFDVSGSTAHEGVWKRRMNEALLFITGEYHQYELNELEELGYTWPKK